MKKLIFIITACCILTLSGAFFAAEAATAGIVSVSLGEYGDILTVDPVLPDEGPAILTVAVYGSDGKIFFAERMTVTEDYVTLPVNMYVELPEGDYTVKVMLWDDPFNMVPLCPAWAGVSGEIPEQTPAPPPTPNPYKGIQIDPDTGLLIPTAYKNGMLPTFEDGKTPDFEIYVSMYGDNDFGDGSFGKPYASVARACRDLSPGGAVRIMPGTYDEWVHFNWSNGHNLFGTEEKPVWLGGVPGMERPVFDSPNGPFFISEFSYLILHDLDVRGTTSPGASVINMHSGGEHGLEYGGLKERVAHHAVLRNIYGSDNSRSAVTLKFAWVEDVVIVDCDIAQGGDYAIDFVGGRNCTVAYNYLHDSPNPQVLLKMKGGSNNFDVYGNLFHNNGNNAIDIGQSTGKESFHPPFEEGVSYEAQNLRIYSNIFFEVNSPFCFWSARDCYAVNNTVVNTKSQLFRLLPGQEFLANGGASHDNTIANNIFYTNRESGGYYINVSSAMTDYIDTFTYSNNLYYSVHAKKTDVGGLECIMPGSEHYVLNHVNSLHRDPLLNDISSLDIKYNRYDLRPGSPAVGAGLNFPFAARDFMGNSYKNVRSLGAIEFME